MEERTRWRSQSQIGGEERRRKVAGLLMLLRPAKSLQNEVGSSGKLEHTGPAEQKRVTSVPYREQLACTPGPSVQSTRF